MIEMTDITGGRQVRRRNEREVARVSVDVADPDLRGENEVDHVRDAGVGHVSEEGESGCGS